MASDSHETLNSFLVERRFDPMFRSFRGIGVASVLDMLVEWSAKAVKTSIGTYAGDTWRNFSAFEIPQGGVEFFVVPGSHEPLIRIDTRSGHRLWLIKADAPTTAFDLPFLAQDLLDGPYERDNSGCFNGVRIPTLEIDTKPDIDWLKNMGVGGTRGITDAFQQFKLRMDVTGAHVKVASGISARGGPVSYQFNQPFLGFFTQPGHDRLPLACFYAGFDAWRTPKGTLNEL